MKGNVINLNTLHLNSVRLNGIGKVQSVSLKGGSTEDPVFPPVEPPIEPEPTPTYTLSASVTNGKVSATRNGSAVNLPFTANEGDTIIVEVTPNDGYTFEGWADGNTDNPRTITMNADVALSAQCVEVVAPPVGKYIQFEDKAVEAVLMANNVSSDGIGITMEDAAKVTKIGTTWFYQNTEIVSFNELKYFTGVTAINANESTGKGSFEGCTSLTSIAFPSSLTSVGQRAFLGCSALSNVANIEVLKTISLNAFYNCTSLAFDEINLPNLTSLGQNAFYGVKIKKLNLGKLTSLPSATASSQNYGDKSVLEEVVLSDSVTNIPNFSFDQYLNLRKIEGVGNVAIIGEYSCRKTMIEEFVAPNATSLLRFSFTSCTRLKHIDVGSIADVGIQALQLCSSLEKVVIRATTPPTMGNAAFGSTNSDFIIYVPDASLEAYKTATNWNQYADRIHPLGEIEGSPYIQFEDAEVERVLMANGVSSDGIGITKDDAAAVTTISTWFNGNTAITLFNELKYFTGVTELTSSAMQNCSALVSANLDNILYLRGSSLNSTGLDKVYLPRVKTISGSALSSTQFSVLLLGKDAATIDNYAIRINSILHTAICLATTPPTIGSGNFTSVNALTSVYVPDASVETYKTASEWSGLASKFKALSQLATDNPSLYSEIEKYL